MWFPVDQNGPAVVDSGGPGSQEHPIPERRVPDGEHTTCQREAPVRHQVRRRCLRTTVPLWHPPPMYSWRAPSSGLGRGWSIATFLRAPIASQPSAASPKASRGVTNAPVSPPAGDAATPCTAVWKTLRCQGWPVRRCPVCDPCGRSQTPAPGAASGPVQPVRHVKCGVREVWEADHPVDRPGVGGREHRAGDCPLWCRRTTRRCSRASWSARTARTGSWCSAASLRRLPAPRSRGSPFVRNWRAPAGRSARWRPRGAPVAVR